MADNDWNLRAPWIAIPPFEATRGDGPEVSLPPASPFNPSRVGGPACTTRTVGELLIDLEEDRAARAVVFGLLAEMER